MEQVVVDGERPAFCLGIFCFIPYLHLMRKCTFAARLSYGKQKTFNGSDREYTELQTLSANAATVDKQWLVVDAEGQQLGRLASKVAKLLRGKHKVNFTPHVDCGDNVVVINAAKVQLSGKKWTDKQYIRHTGYPGGQRSTTPTELLEKNPNRIVR